MGERNPPAETRADPRAEREPVAAGLVHELRQPLTGIEAGLRLVERELGASVTELDGWKLATRQLARVGEMLQTHQLLMSSERTGDGPFVLEPIMRRAVEELRHRLDPARHRVAIVVEPDVPQAYGSPLALLHALTNLLANAIDAVDATGKPGRIELRAARTVDAVPRAQLRIADEGPGIPPERRRRLFRVGFTTKSRGGGSGLGLVVSRRMLRRAGGELRLASPGDPSCRPWSTTEFVVDLAASSDAPAPRELPRPRRALVRRTGVVAALFASVAAVLAVSWLGFQRWVRAGDAAPAAAVVAAPIAVEVLSADGQVERRRDREWEPVTSGQRLLPDDSIRAAAGAGASLAIGAATRVVVSDATELTVREITAAVQRLQLTRGRLSVDHQADGARVLVVESEGGDAVARAGTARFSVLASGTALAVATQAGVVRLHSAGQAVEVAAGQQSVSFKGRGPARPSQVPVTLLLRIARAARDRGGSCLVEGVVDPGAEVRVDGQLVDPGPRGRFAVRVPRSDGRNEARVVTRDAAGRAVERRVECAEDHGVSDFAVRWGQDAPAPKAE
jgi:two-component sensor histidine kinase